MSALERTGFRERFSGLGPRVLSAVVFLPLLYWLGIRGGIGVALLINTAFALAVHEWRAMAGARGRRFDVALIYLGTLALLNLGFWPEQVHLLPWVLAGATMVTAARRALTPPPDGMADDWAVSTTAFLYLGVLGSFLPRLLSFESQGPAGPIPDGAAAFFLLFVLAFATDSFAYFGGLLMGKTPLFPKVSPKKSREGLVGGMAGAALMAFGAASLFAPFLNPLHLAAFGAVAALVGQLGDLVESALKRDAGVKDASNVVPGHGGILDRLDSLLFIAPLLHFYLQWQSRI